MSLLTNLLLTGGVAAIGGVVVLVGRGKSDPLKVGDQMPDCKVTIQSGEELALRGGAGFRLVYFFPKADTPGCTKQACSLRDSFSDLVERGVSVLGVSTDGERDLQRFKEKYELPFDLVADRDGELANAFGVPLRFTKFAARQSFLFKDDCLIWRDLGASTAEQAGDVIEVLEEWKE